MKSQNRHLCGLLLIACVMAFWATESCRALIVSEVMYHPTDDGETLEFIELYNNRAVFEDISGFAFTNGIDYVFGPDTIIAAKGYLVVARDPAALEAAYGITGVLGPFSGRFGNDGERIELSNANRRDRHLVPLRQRPSLAHLARRHGTLAGPWRMPEETSKTVPPGRPARISEAPQAPPIRSRSNRRTRPR